MAKDVEEGEISDTASVEEITEEDFINNQEVTVVKETKPPAAAATTTNPRVWTMRDLYNKYPAMCRGYTSSGLYNFAWAQAVQNKPLNVQNEIFVLEVEQDDVSKKSSPSSSAASVNSGGGGDKKQVVEKVVIDDSGDEMEVKVVDVDDEKEEGELEEGEIDLDSESTGQVLINGGSLDKVLLLEKRVNSMKEAFESVVNVVDADNNSFQEVCSKLQNTLESLQEVILEINDSTKDALIQLSFSAVQAVNTVFCSMNHDLKEQNKDIFSRLLSHVKINGSLFYPDQMMKEIGVMVSSLDTPDVFQTEMPAIDGVNKKDSNALAENVSHDLASENNFSSPVESLMYNKPYMSMESSKPFVSGFRSRGGVLPLLDLHKDHDEDSLPSPTRETTPWIPVNRALVVPDSAVKSAPAMAKAAHGNEDSKMRHYETEAFKAVSSYQQKFGRSSFFFNDTLPSPTPSEESGDGDGDTVEEISGSSTVDNLKLENPPILGKQVVSSSQHMDISSSQSTTARNAAPVSSAPNPVMKSSAKSRDPRLRFANSDALDLNQRPSTVVHNAPKVEPVVEVMSSRKQKTMDEFAMAGPALKRQRNGLESSGVVRDVKTVSGSGGWLEDTDMVGPQTTNNNRLVEYAESDPRKLDNGANCPSTTTGVPNVSVSGNVPSSVPVPCTTASLPALLKDIAVNPTMLINLLNMGKQQRLAAEAQQRPADPLTSTMHPPSFNSTLGTVPLVGMAPSMPSAMLPKPIGTLQVPPATPADESGKIRMKPRDPRRLLQGNALQRSGSLGPEQYKANGISTPSIQGSKDNLNSQKQHGQPEAKPHAPPDITRQFTKNLKNIADIISVSQTVTSQPMVSQNLPSQPVQINLDKVDVKAAVSNHDDRKTGTVSAPDVGPAGPHSQNTWGDVEHLFEGYDDKQKAAIQKERSRRLDEQKKMFAEHKLCLVLDLDHTLLNSAKFNEVDPVHDEILRKKEEQDREKPPRHLFRFPHMGMWTKLRPGIWTFLERASKLFEMHLYTMGNKLYATEMAKVLDPKGVLFNGRVISKGDDGDSLDNKSKDLEGVLGMESAVVIIDDSVRVWPHNKLNLIVVERYTYFPCSRRQFGLPGPSLLEIDHDERPDAGTLASSLAVIERIHQNFFSHQALDEVDVRNILASEQRKILSGCRIVFSRVFPVGEANPQLHPLWQTAEQFGAVCTIQLDEQVTHVVANSLGTDKVNWAISKGRYVVHPGWVEASALLYRRANEQDFAIKQ